MKPKFDMAHGAGLNDEILDEPKLGGWNQTVCKDTQHSQDSICGA
jgi:hypothetical protein